MRTGKPLAGLLAALVVAACSTSRAPSPVAPASPPDAPSPTAPRVGYVPGGIAEPLALLQPAPQADDARDAADRRIFVDTRAYQGSARWHMASADAALAPEAMLRHFACSLDVELTSAQAPKLMRLLQRASVDATRIAGVGKDHFRRLRPFLVAEGPICRPRAELANSFDYPSGHATFGWAWALTLSQVDPAHGPALLARGRAIGDSRIVCGVHNSSAVQAGRDAATAAFALFASRPDYQHDVHEAAQELAGLRASAARPEPAACAAERDLLALPVFASGGSEASQRR